MNPKRLILPAVTLILFCIAESGLKSYVHNSSIRVASLVIFLAALFYLASYYRKQNAWESFFEPSAGKWETPILIGIIALGTLLRFWRLDSLFDGMLWDEAYKGLDALAIRKFGERPIFLDWNAGREALIAYLVAASQKIFDESILSVRAVMALAGCLTLVFFYLFVKTIFNSQTALLSTFLLAVSKWHLIHTRLGIRVPLIVLFEVLVLFCIARAVRAKQQEGLKWFVLAGIATGLGFYTYIAFRAFPVVILAFVLEKDVRGTFRMHARSIATGCVVALLVAAPLAKYYWENRQSFTERMERTAVWKTRGANRHATELIADATLKTLGMFTYEGDHIARLNVHQEPMLSVFSSSFFVLGVLLCFLNFRKPYSRFLLIYLIVTLLPGMLSVNAPHSSRTIGAVAPVMLIATFGMLTAWNTIRAVSALLATTFFAVLIAGNFYTGINDGLFRYSAILDSLDHTTSSLWGTDRDEFRVTQLLNQLGNRCDMYLAPQFFFHSAIEYLTYGKSQHKLFTLETKIDHSTAQKIPVIVVQHQQTNLWWLRDDEGKRFFKWWTQAHGFEANEIHSIVLKTYISYPKMTRTNDFRLVQHIRRSYPTARELNLGSFTAFLLRNP